MQWHVLSCSGTRDIASESNTAKIVGWLVKGFMCQSRAHLVPCCDVVAEHDQLCACGWVHVNVEVYVRGGCEAATGQVPLAVPLQAAGKRESHAAGVQGHSNEPLSKPSTIVQHCNMNCILQSRHVELVALTTIRQVAVSTKLSRVKRKCQVHGAGGKATCSVIMYTCRYGSRCKMPHTAFYRGICYRSWLALHKLVVQSQSSTRMGAHTQHTTHISTAAVVHTDILAAHSACSLHCQSTCACHGAWPGCVTPGLNTLAVQPAKWSANQHWQERDYYPKTALGLHTNPQLHQEAVPEQSLKSPRAVSGQFRCTQTLSCKKQQSQSSPYESQSSPTSVPPLTSSCSF